MNPTQLIAKKRDGGELTAEEIAFLIDGHVQGRIPDYQMAAMLIAMFVRGLNDAETAALTDSMLRSGVTLTWPESSLPRVDKHSTGGIGDKVSLPLAPLLACCGVCVPMLSGRGLGPTGGTLDKLESIAGFRTNLSLDEIRRLTEQVGCVITGTTPELVPADRQLYALRDVTATVPSVPLITASIMSKKLAEGLNALVLDVKFGRGAFMKTRAIARELAAGMVAVGQRMGVATTAFLTDMNQPLGRMAGNAVEVDESLDCLRGGGPSDLRELVLELAEDVLVSAKVSATRTEARAKLLRELDSGRAFERFERMVVAQGGRLDVARPIAPAQELCGARSGIVESIDTESLGWIIIDLGGGRRQLTDAIDHSVGLEMLVRIGDEVQSGQPLVRVFAPPAKFEEVAARLRSAITIGDEPTDAPLLIIERLG
ncbi:MAG: thymidine phosphorylase [Planctomycetaceae bacterium]|nr:thymidine phosphorylase [Planctomycetaceae bacterium]